MEDVCFYTLSHLSELIRERSISCEAVLNSFFKRISVFNKTINCVVNMFAYADLLREARFKDDLLEQDLYEGPLHGIPMTVKDSFDVVGLKSTLGNPLLKFNYPKQDAELVKRLKESGAIIMGKTNLPLFSMDWKSENWWYGRTVNPYNSARTVGGSSGGSAAAVAAGFSPVELGSDAGGSIRVPAHFCGICGLRPSEGILSNVGHMRKPGKSQVLKYITVPGPLAKNVTDLEILYDVLADNSPSSDISNLNEYKPSSKKVAFSLQLGDVEISHEYRTIIYSFLTSLKTEGFTVVEDQPKYDNKKAYSSWATIIGMDLKHGMPNVLFKAFFASAFIRWRFRDRLWAKGTYEAVSGNQQACSEALSYKEEMSESFNAFFKLYDVWITPVCPVEAFTHQPTGRPLSVNQRKLDYTYSMGTYSFSTALPGHPICVIPIGKMENGLPVGVQIHAKKFDDKKLLQIAKAIENVKPGYSLPKM